MIARSKINYDADLAGLFHARIVRGQSRECSNLSFPSLLGHIEMIMESFSSALLRKWHRCAAPDCSLTDA